MVLLNKNSTESSLLRVKDKCFNPEVLLNKKNKFFLQKLVKPRAYIIIFSPLHPHTARAGAGERDSTAATMGREREEVESEVVRPAPFRSQEMPDWLSHFV